MSIVGYTISLYKKFALIVAGKLGYAWTETALMKAARGGDGGKICKLLASGADINRMTAAKETALFYCIKAIRPGCPETAVSGRLALQQAIAFMLLRQGAEFTTPNRNGEYPFALAIERGMSDVALFMLGKTGADTVKSQNCLVLACKANHPPVLVHRLAAISPGAINAALCAAAGAGGEENARLLLSLGADCSLHPVFDAVKAGCAPLVTEFLRRGDSPDVKKDGLPCAFFALERPDILRLLLDAGADCEAVFNDPRPGNEGREINLIEFAGGFSCYAEALCMLETRAAR